MSRHESAVLRDRLAHGGHGTRPLPAWRHLKRLTVSVAVLALPGTLMGSPLAGAAEACLLYTSDAADE